MPRRFARGLPMMAPMPTLRQLRTFTVIAEAESLSKAATLLGVVPSALTLHVAALEKELDCQLLRRDGRGVRPTEQGLELLYRARKIVSSIQNLENDIRGIGRDVNGEVSLGLLPSLVGRLTVPLHDALYSRFPSLRLRIADGLSGDLAEHLDLGHLDVATLYRHQLRSNQVSHLLVIESLCLVGPFDAGTTSGNTAGFAEALDRPLAVPSSRHALRGLLDTSAAAIGRCLTVHAEVDSLAAIEALLVARAVSAILPQSLAAPIAARSAGRLTAICLEGLERHVHLALPRKGGNSAATQLFKLVLELNPSASSAAPSCGGQSRL